MSAAAFTSSPTPRVNSASLASFVGKEVLLVGELMPGSTGRVVLTASVSSEPTCWGSL